MKTAEKKRWYSRWFAQDTAAGGAPPLPSTASPNDWAPKPEELRGRWIAKNTAILVIHGIGDQRPLETLDLFGTSLARVLAEDGGFDLDLTHMAKYKADKETSGGWFQNYVRIHDAADPSRPYLDLHEYYWANMTEDAANLSDIKQWVAGVARGAQKHYAANSALCAEYSDQSIFFSRDKKGKGQFHRWRYHAVLTLVMFVLPAVEMITTGVLKFFGKTPGLGFLNSFATTIEKTLFRNLSNIVGDITVYNAADEKSRFNLIRRKILEGAVNAVTELLAPYKKEGEQEYQWEYDNVIVATHSLGTQVGYDAINRINFVLQTKGLAGYSAQSFVTDAGTTQTFVRSDGKHIEEVLSGFVTFGSPLDKLAFFMRDQFPDEQFLRQEILTDYYGFRQRAWTRDKVIPMRGERELTLRSPFVRLFENVRWHNYHHPKDPVSGSLDFYSGVINRQCVLSGKFTHCEYWAYADMYRDILNAMVLHD